MLKQTLTAKDRYREQSDLALQIDTVSANSLKHQKHVAGGKDEASGMGRWLREAILHINSD